MTDLMAERENAFVEGREQGKIEGKAEGLTEGFNILESLGVSKEILEKAKQIAADKAKSDNK